MKIAHCLIEMERTLRLQNCCPAEFRMPRAMFDELNMEVGGALDKHGEPMFIGYPIRIYENVR